MIRHRCLPAAFLLTTLLTASLALAQDKTDKADKSDKQEKSDSAKPDEKERTSVTNHDLTLADPTDN